LSGKAAHGRAAEIIDEVFGGRRLVYSTTSFIKKPLIEALERIAAGGFRNVEVWGNNMHLDPRNPDIVIEEVELCRRRLGLEVVSVHAPFTVGEYGDPPAEKMRAWESLVKESMDLAEYLGAHHLVVHPFTAGRDSSDREYREMIERTQESLLRLADLAAEREFVLGLENMPAHRNRRYGREVRELYDFVNASGRSSLALCVDTGHVIFNNGDPMAELEACGNRVSSVHLNDNVANIHLDLHLVPGTGGLDLARLAEALRAPAFNGMIVLELDGRGRPSSIFEEACAFARRYFLGGEEQAEDSTSGKSASGGTEHA